jgi:AmiR/NasT family two-component response regulator
MAEALAVQATALIDLRRQVVNLQAAMRSRELIGQACGVLMSRYRLTEEQVMDALRLVSQHRNVKLRELSAEVTESGTLVELD